MLLSSSIGTFLTNYDVTNINFNMSLFTPLYENEQFESKTIQRRLLILARKGWLLKSAIIGKPRKICYTYSFLK